MNTVAICKYMLEQKDKQIQELQNRIAELEAMLESIGAGGIGPMIAAPRQPLTPDVSGVDGVNARLHFRRGWKSAERAHGITGE